ncbi:hypothetical protein FC82_GL000502 [Secundilactobacillus collinoides DSM 20515 = JCM 1123]|uniref:Uncharacterized protein n=1 Tax=Secundilactobacillus collinoides DSM 20515 = JCM 1123 TaxID=1423733 RepID=A0A0R2BM92_SECCO|nr:hypothetical protein FC82_GL000502 [Secundilactobacillus collinoides DSM 20515 = JCM 1123]
MILIMVSRTIFCVLKPLLFINGQVFINFIDQEITVSQTLTTPSFWVHFLLTR